MRVRSNLRCSIEGFFYPPRRISHGVHLFGFYNPLAGFQEANDKRMLVAKQYCQMNLTGSVQLLSVQEYPFQLSGKLRPLWILPFQGPDLVSVF